MLKATGVPVASGMPDLQRVLDPRRVAAVSLPGFLLGHPVAGLPSALRDLVGDGPEPQLDGRRVHAITLLRVWLLS